MTRCFCTRAPYTHEFDRKCNQLITAWWRDPRRIPLGFAAHARRGVVYPETIQANLFTLVQIGGSYDIVALQVEKEHLVILAGWRLDSGAPTVLDYLKARDHRGPLHRNEIPNA